MLSKSKIFDEIIQTLYPDDIKCIVCGNEIFPNRYCICADCSIESNVNYCIRCGRHKVGTGDYCSDCSEFSVYFDEARSPANYEGEARKLVQRFKYGNAPYLAKPMSEYMLDTLLLSDWDIDCITFVPIHKKRRKQRGYNQAELLALSLAERVDIPCIPLLEKTESTVNQARLNKAERMKNLHGTFAAAGKPPDHVLLVDDVMTTGSTASECSKVLKRAGAKVVYLLTFASVPERPMLDTAANKISEFRN